MTTLRDPAATETDPGAPLVSALFKALANNLRAAFEGDATAVAAGIQLRAAALKTVNASQAYSFGGGGGSLQILMHKYSFFPANVGTASLLFLPASDPDVPKLSITSSGTASGTVHWRYVS